MGLMEDIGKRIAQSGQDTIKKAKSYAETAKINGQIAEEQRVLTAFYAQMGEKYYNLHKGDPTDEFAQYCDRITAGQMRIAELQMEIQRLKNSRFCSNCGAECPLNVQFCSSCGTRLPSLEPEITPVESVPLASQAESAPLDAQVQNAEAEQISQPPPNE